MKKLDNQFNLSSINPLNAELNPICYLLALLAHHFLHVSRIRVKSLTLRLIMPYIYIYIYIYIYDISSLRVNGDRYLKCTPFQWLGYCNQNCIWETFWLTGRYCYVDSVSKMDRIINHLVGSKHCLYDTFCRMLFPCTLDLPAASQKLFPSSQRFYCIHKFITHFSYALISVPCKPLNLLKKRLWKQKVFIIISLCKPVNYTESTK